jgi:deoxyribonuclease IV
MLLGIHGSVRNGLANALMEAEDARCPVLQMLPYRRHATPDEEEMRMFRARLKRTNVTRLIVHSRFVPSLASSDETRRARSVELLAQELDLAGKLGAESYVLHAGAFSPGATAEQGLDKAAASIKEALSRAAFGGPILIENVPGGGRRLCGPLEELAALRDRLSGIMTGICLDTAHAWAAGYDLSSLEGALKFTAKANKLFGDAVACFHLNDSGALLGSHVENHAHWGRGRLGKEGIAALLARPEYQATPAVVETPKEPGADRLNLDWLQALAT